MSWTANPRAFFALCALLALHGVAQQPVASTDQHARRANYYLRANQPQKAIAEFAALVDADPNNLNAQTNLGVLLYFAGRNAEAQEPLQKAIQLDPTLHKIEALLGLCDARLGQLSAARQHLSAALEHPLDARLEKEVGLRLIEIQSAQHDLNAAAATVGRLSEHAPTDPDILFVSYRIHTDLASESLLSLSLAAPRSARMHQAIAHELERGGDNSDAIISYRNAVAADTNLPGIHYELAEALRSANTESQRAMAEKEYALALESNPRDAMAAAHLADLRIQHGDVDGAATLYTQALTFDPANIDATLGMANVAEEHNDSTRQLEYLQQVLHEDPSNLKAHFRLMGLYRRLHRPTDAQRELDTYQKLKKIKDNLREVYQEMHVRAPHAADDSSDDNRSPAVATH